MKPKTIQLSIFIFVWFLFFSSYSSAFLNHDETGTYAADFLNIGVGAKATAMGKAYVGLANDISAIYWNPSGLVQLNQPQVEFSHTRWFSDIEYEYLGLSLPLSSRNVIAGGVMYLHMGSTLGYDEQDQPTSSLTAYDAEVMLALSSCLSSNLSLGLTLKGIQERLESATAQSMAMDIGACYIYRRFSFGLVARNLGSSLKFIRQKAPLPSSVTTGMAVRPVDHLIFTTDIDLWAADSPILRQGVEYNYRDQVFLRTGYECRNMGGGKFASPTPALGGGLKISNFQFDYTFSPYKLMGDTHTITFVYMFGHI
ncbi:MAG: PorV/PorQ family protein [Candidatus Zixiibacteriota bacterium]